MGHNPGTSVCCPYPVTFRHCATSQLQEQPSFAAVLTSALSKACSSRLLRRGPPGTGSSQMPESNSTMTISTKILRHLQLIIKKLCVLIFPYLYNNTIIEDINT